MRATTKQRISLLTSIIDELASVGILSRFTERVEAYEEIKAQLKQYPLNYPIDEPQKNSNEFVYIAICHCNLLKGKAKDYNLNHTLKNIANNVELALSELID